MTSGLRVAIAVGVLMLISGLPGSPAAAAAERPTAAETAAERPAAAETAAETPPCDVLLFDATVEDQFESDRSTAELHDTIAVVVWSDRKASEWAASWAELLADGLRGQIEGDLVELRAWAHTKGAPFFVKGRIRGSFPEQRAAWAFLDWDGRWKEHYDPREDHVTAYVFDRAGCLVARETGTEADAAAVARLVRAAQEILIRDHETATGETPRTGEIDP